MSTGGALILLAVVVWLVLAAAVTAGMEAGNKDLEQPGGRWLP